MPAEFVLQLAKWDSLRQTLQPRKPCRIYQIDGASEAARILVCEARQSSNGGLALYQEIAAQLSGYSNRVCNGPVWPNCRTHKVSGCRQILAINLGSQSPAGLDAWVKSQWSLKFNHQGIVVPLVPAALARSLILGVHLGTWQVAFWSAGLHERATDVLRVAGIGSRKSIFISYVRDEAAPLAAELWKSLGESGFEVFVDRFTGTLGQKFPEEIEERVATAEAVVLLQSPSHGKSKWVRREIAVARNVGTGVLAVSEKGSKLPKHMHPDDVLQRPPSVWKTPSRGDIDSITQFINMRSAMAALRASVYCEASMRRAARTHSLNVRVVGSGLFDVAGALIAPRGQPPRVSDLHSSALASNGRPLAVVGEMQTLRPTARAPIEWVASSNSIALRRRADLPALMMSIKTNGKP